MANKFNEIIKELMSIYGGETDFIRALKRKNNELVSCGASDQEADAALRELMAEQYRRINRSVSPQDTDGDSTRAPGTSYPSDAKNSADSLLSDNVGAKSVLTSSQKTLKDYFDSLPVKVRYNRFYDTDSRIVYTCNYILDNTIRLPVKIVLERQADTHTCSLIATLPLTVQSEFIYPVSRKLLEINSSSPEPFGAFCLGKSAEAGGVDSGTVSFRYTFIIDNGLSASEFGKYFNSVLRSVLRYYDDILIYAKGHFKSSEIKEITDSIRMLDNTLSGLTL